MRLFVAVDLDAALREAVGDLITDARAAIDREAPRAARAFKWVDPRNLHLTMHFLGEVDDSRVGPLREHLSTAASTGAFTLALGGIGCFPPGGPPRVVWLGLTQGAGQLTALHAELGDRLRDLRFEVEARPFHPHLTLARVKAPVPPGLRETLRRVPSDRVGECPVTAATLYRSVLGPGGPTYTALATTGLQAP